MCSPVVKAHAGGSGPAMRRGGCSGEDQKQLQVAAAAAAAAAITAAVATTACLGHPSQPAKLAIDDAAEALRGSVGTPNGQEAAPFSLHGSAAGSSGANPAGRAAAFECLCRAAELALLAFAPQDEACSSLSPGPAVQPPAALPRGAKARPAALGLLEAVNSNSNLPQCGMEQQHQQALLPHATGIGRSGTMQPSVLRPSLRRPPLPPQQQLQQQGARRPGLAGSKRTREGGPGAGENPDSWRQVAGPTPWRLQAAHPGNGGSAAQRAAGLDSAHAGAAGAAEQLPSAGILRCARAMRCCPGGCGHGAQQCSRAAGTSGGANSSASGSACGFSPRGQAYVARGVRAILTHLPPEEVQRLLEVRTFLAQF